MCRGGLPESFMFLYCYISELFDVFLTAYFCLMNMSTEKSEEKFSQCFVQDNNASGDLG